MGFGENGGGEGTDPNAATKDELNDTNINVTLTNWQLQNQLNLTQLPQKDGFVDYFVDETHTNTTDTTLVYDAAGDLYTNPEAIAAGGYDFELLINQSNGTNTFTDDSQNGLTTTGYGGIDFETDAGAYNGAATSIVFDGSTQYIATADSANFDLGADNDIILEFAFNADNVTGTKAIMSRWEGASKKSIAINLVGADLGYLISSDGSTDGAYTNIKTGLSASTWYHVLFIYERQTDTVKAFVNGELTLSATETRAPFDTDIGWSIGARRTGTGDNADTYFDGKIGLARIVSGDKRYLGDADTDSVARGEDFVLQATGNADASTTFTDLSSNSYTVTGGAGSAWANEASPYSDDHATSLTIDADNEILTLPDGVVNTDSDITFEMIVKFGSTDNQEMCLQQAGALNDVAFNLLLSGTLGTLTFYRSSDGSTLSSDLEVSGLGLTTNTWYHIRVVYARDPIRFEVYVDGDLKGSDTTGTVLTLNDSAANVTIGGGAGRTTGNYTLSGYKITNAVVPATMLSEYESLKQFPVDNDTNYDFVLDMSQADASTTFDDLSTNDYTVTATGGLAFSRSNGTYVPNRSYLPLDGTDDYFQVDGTSLDMNDDFTIECVIRINDWSELVYPFYYGDGPNNSNISRFIMIANSTGDITMYSSSNGSALVSNITADCGTSISGTIGQWIHLRITYEHSTASLRVYVDGVLVGSDLNNTVTTAYTGTQEDIYCGVRGTVFSGIDIASYRLAQGVQEPVFFTDPFTDLSAAASDANGNYVSLTESADSAPSEIRLLCLIETTGTLNTDVIGEVSRDGGTTWTQVTLEYTVAFEGAVSCAASDPVDVTGQPSGTDVVGRIRSINDVTTDVHGFSMGW